MEDEIRLAKLMAQRNICSRREAEKFIEQKQVEVDGIIISKQGVKVSINAKIKLLKDAEKKQKNLVTIILNKPVGYVSTQPEKNYEAAISLINEKNRFIYKDKNIKFSKSHLVKLSPVGRLDIDSKGLLLLTQDGKIAKKVIGPTSNIEKEYLVRFDGILTSKNLNLLKHGLELDGKVLKKAKIDKIDDNFLKIILIEGKKRQIRRMMEIIGLRVISLKRVRIGPICLGKLPIGRWRYLTEKEKRDLLNIREF